MKTNSSHPTEHGAAVTSVMPVQNTDVTWPECDRRTVSVLMEGMYTPAQINTHTMVFWCVYVCVQTSGEPCHSWFTALLTTVNVTNVWEDDSQTQRWFSQRNKTSLDAVFITTMIDAWRGLFRQTFVLHVVASSPRGHAAFRLVSCRCNGSQSGW